MMVASPTRSNLWNDENEENDNNVILVLNFTFMYYLLKFYTCQMNDDFTPAAIYIIILCSPLLDGPPYSSIIRSREQQDAPRLAALPQLAQPAPLLHQPVGKLKQHKVKVDNLVGDPRHLRREHDSDTSLHLLSPFSSSLVSSV